MRLKKSLKWVGLIILGAGFLSWMIPFAHNEILTFMHGNEFKDEYKQLSYVQDNEKVEFFRVLEYTSTKAEVYYIHENNGAGEIYTFKKIGGVWVLEQFDTMWTTLGGNADNILWPYFWDVFRFWYK